jgi:hypothetical protein
MAVCRARSGSKLARLVSHPSGTVLSGLVDAAITSDSDSATTGLDQSLVFCSIRA